MRTTLSMLLIFGALSAGCSPSLPGEAKDASALLESAPVDEACTPGKGSVLVEGFGSRTETQLIVTQRQPVSRCKRGVPNGRTATLAPQE